MSTPSHQSWQLHIETYISRQTLLVQSPLFSLESQSESQSHLTSFEMENLTKGFRSFESTFKKTWGGEVDLGMGMEGVGDEEGPKKGAGTGKKGVGKGKGRPKKMISNDGAGGEGEEDVKPTLEQLESV